MTLRNRHYWLRFGVPLVGMAMVLVVFVITTVMHFPKAILAAPTITWWLLSVASQFIAINMRCPRCNTKFGQYRSKCLGIECKGQAILSPQCQRCGHPLG